MQELKLEDQQWQLDQELRGYMNREGRWGVERGGHHEAGVCSLVTSDTDQAMWSSSLSASETFQEEAREWGFKPLLCLQCNQGCTIKLLCKIAFKNGAAAGVPGCLRWKNVHLLISRS